MEINFKGARPPKGIGPIVEVTRITSSEKRSFTFVSDQPWGYFFHWFGGRSRECTSQDDLQTCERCQQQWPRKWRGYVHAKEYQEGLYRDVILELTDNALAMIATQCAGRKTLRGAQIQIAKSKGGKHGRFIVTVLERVIHHQDMVEIEPLPILKKLWDVNEDRLKKINKQPGEI